MLLALTTDQKLGLAGTAAVFIVFSLVVALWIPRNRPDFPGPRGLVPFILVTVILTIAMLGAVEVFAVEEHHGGAATETHAEEPAPSPGPTPPPAEEPSGDAAAGEAVYAANGCGGCHVFEPAGSEGQIGPNLDETLQGKDTEYVRTSIVEPNAVVADGYQAGVMPENYGEQLSDEELANLVAFLQS